MVSPPFELGASHVIAASVVSAIASTYCGADGGVAARAGEVPDVINALIKSVYTTQIFSPINI